LKLNRNWKGGHRIELSLPMRVELVESHPFVRDNLGKVAVKRGPVIYCAEQVDNPNFHVWTLGVGSEDLEEERAKILDRDAVFLRGTGKALVTSDWEGALYRKISEPKEKVAKFTLVPYHMWANRQPGAMVVWLLKS